MGSYIIRRLILIVPTVFIATLIVFSIIRLIPGDVVDQILIEHEAVTAITRAEVEKALGLDVPIHVQYGRWVWAIISRGDLGKSFWKMTPVTRDIISRLPVTLELAFIALLVGQLIALPIGIWSAIRQDSWSDYAGRSFAILNLSVPSFWMGTMIMTFPAIWWGWSPPVKLISFSEDPIGNLTMFILPAVVLGMHLSGTTMRMMRTMMLEVLRQDYLRTAWAKGLGEKTVVMRHALKNAMIPVITIIGLQIPILFGGTVIIENIFALPGLGNLTVEATYHRDYPVVTGVMLFFAGVVLVMNLIVDLAYAYLDPRIRLG